MTWLDAVGHNGSPEEFWGGAHKCLSSRPQGVLQWVNMYPCNVRGNRGRTVTGNLTLWRVRRSCLYVWLPIAALMTFQTLLLINFLQPSDAPSRTTPGQVPHFVCTADGDGTILRCGFSALAQPRL